METSVLMPQNINKICPGCLSSVFANDAQVSVSQSPWHKVCFKCAECNCQLTLSNFAMGGNIALCKTHYFTRFYKNNAYEGGNKYIKKTGSPQEGESHPVVNNEGKVTLKENLLNCASTLEIPFKENINKVASSETSPSEKTTEDTINKAPSEISPVECTTPVEKEGVYGIPSNSQIVNQKRNSSSIQKSKPVLKLVDVVKCAQCDTSVYHNDPKVSLERHTWHNSCFKCFKCNCQLTLSNYALMGKKAICKIHYLELFHLTNCYDGDNRSFANKGLDQAQDKEKREDDSPLNSKSNDEACKVKSGEHQDKVIESFNHDLNNHLSQSSKFCLWECHVCSFKNHPSDVVCICETPRERKEVSHDILPKSLENLKLDNDDHDDQDDDDPAKALDNSINNIPEEVDTRTKLTEDVKPTKQVSDIEQTTRCLQSECTPTKICETQSKDDEISGKKSVQRLGSPVRIQMANRMSGAPKCKNCEKSVYHNDMKVQVNDMMFHQGCFKCAECSCQLTLASYTTGGDKLYCKTHYFALFHRNNGYAGAEQFRRQ